jgi:hypothetical protein
MHLSVDLYQIVWSLGSHVAARNHKSSTKKADAIPTRAGWSGGAESVRAFTKRFYEKALRRCR